MLRQLLLHFMSENRLRELKFSRELYHLSFREAAPRPMVISCFEGGNGFADRLRGVISAFANAQCLGVPYRLEHNEPYRWEDYFVPNGYDWRLRAGEKSMNLRFARPDFFMDDRRGDRILTLSPRLQHHLYSNSDFLELLNARFGHRFRYHELYQTLFRPSPALQASIDEARTALGTEDYISVSFRFQRLMGDFEDIVGRVLPEPERVRLLKKCRQFLIDLKAQHSEVEKILITSDSATFVRAIEDLGFVYVIPGSIGHIGTAQNQEVILKTFQDFCMISHARRVYMAHTGEMYRGGFAQSAAATTNAPYEELRF